MKKIILIGCCLCSLLFTGCLSLEYQGKSSEPTVAEPTIGKQLMDLKSALENGAISEDEYKALRKRLLDE
tara:strand:- start:217 stop:426 length:210 start_codon:yes stop_codon:yes gene_type:complete